MIGSAASTSAFRSRAWQRRVGSRPLETVVLGIVMVAALATVATGLALGRDRLGVATPPFVADWAPKLHPLAAVSLVVLAAGCAAAPRLLALRPVAFVAALWAIALALGLALNAARLGTAGWSAVFDLRRGGEAVNEYLPGLPAIGYGVRFYLDRFAELVPSQPVNVAGHPPGPLLLVHALGHPLGRRVGGTVHRRRLAHRAADLRAGARSPARAHRAHRRAPGRLLAGRAARRRDLVRLRLRRARHRRGRAARPPPRRGRRRGARRRGAVLVGASRGGGVGRARRRGAQRRPGGPDRRRRLRRGDDRTRGGHGRRLGLRPDRDPARDRRRLRPQHRLHAALPVLGVRLRGGLGRHARAADRRSSAAGLVRRDAAAVALAAVLAAAALAGFTKAETERIWLFLVPFACTAAAPSLADRRLRPVLALLAAQALVVQALFATVW